MKTIAYLALLAAMTLTGGNANAGTDSETDPFTARTAEVKDATGILNEKMNEILDEAAASANASKPGCDARALQQSIQKLLNRPLYGKFEGWINQKKSPVPKVRVKVNESVYQDLKIYQNAPTRLGRLGMGSTVSVNGNFVGSDKFGHFFVEGFREYAIYLKTGSIESALEFGTRTENGLFGKRATAVKSYADMVANYNGMNFWSRVTGTGLVDGKKAHFECSGKKWKRVTQFDWLDYVDAAWDEGINCSEFKNAKIDEKINSRILALEKEYGRRFQCPIEAEKCAALRAKYATQAETLLSPKCN